jgi:hypothetical protein
MQNKPPPPKPEVATATNSTPQSADKQPSWQMDVVEFANNGCLVNGN